MAAMTQRDVDGLVERLRKHRDGLREDIASGNGDAHAAATAVYRCYTMVARLPEHGAMLACEQALDTWLKTTSHK